MHRQVEGKRGSRAGAVKEGLGRADGPGSQRALISPRLQIESTVRQFLSSSFSLCVRMGRRRVNLQLMCRRHNSA